jgi:hypothetical protein
MNYFSHVALACRFEHSAAFYLGSMLPDFASIVRCRTPLCSNELVCHGMGFHHLSDSVFHDLPEFREWLRGSVAELVSLGVKKGPARAAAHIGIELLLDAALASLPEPLEALRLALAVASPQQLANELNWRDPNGSERFEDLRLRLLERSGTRRNYTIEMITARLVYAFADRPRLRLTGDEHALIETWLRSMAPRVDAGWPSLWLALVQCVSSHWSD